MNDDFLTRFRKAPRPEFAASLYQRISKPMTTQTKQPALRFAALTLSLLAVLTATLLLSPSARAFAQGFIRQVGAYVFTQEGSIDQNTKTPKDISIEWTQDSVSIHASKNIPSATDPAEASQLAGFTVLTPTYLPEGYTSMSGWLVTSEGNSAVVTNGYKDGTNNFFAINQAKFGTGAPEQTFHRDQIVDVTVRGQSGVWLPAPADGKKALVWEENGITYSIISNSLSLDEMLKVAESLGQ